MRFKAASVLPRRLYHNSGLKPLSLLHPMASTENAFQRCINPDCTAQYAVGEVLASCPVCGDILDVEYEWDRLPVPKTLREFEARWGRRNEPLEFSGVW